MKPFDIIDNMCYCVLMFIIIDTPEVPWMLGAKVTLFPGHKLLAPATGVKPEEGEKKGVWRGIYAAVDDAPDAERHMQHVTVEDFFHSSVC